MEDFCINFVEFTVDRHTNNFFKYMFEKDMLLYFLKQINLNNVTVKF